MKHVHNKIVKFKNCFHINYINGYSVYLEPEYTNIQIQKISRQFGQNNSLKPKNNFGVTKIQDISFI